MCGGISSEGGAYLLKSLVLVPEPLYLRGGGGRAYLRGGLIYEIQRYVLDDLIFAQNHL